MEVKVHTNVTFCSVNMGENLGLLNFDANSPLLLFNGNNTLQSNVENKKCLFSSADIVN